MGGTAAQPPCPRRVKFNRTALLAAYKAHVRSIAEYGSVVWSGAAKTHLVRLEQMQHRFFMWLASNSDGDGSSLDYVCLLNRIGLCSIKSRFVQADLSFLVNVYCNRIECPYLLSLRTSSPQKTLSTERAVPRTVRSRE